MTLKYELKANYRFGLTYKSKIVNQDFWIENDKEVKLFLKPYSFLAL